MVETRRPSGLILTSEHGYDTLRADIDARALVLLRRGAHLLPFPVPADEEELWRQKRTLLVARCHAVAGTLTCRYAFGQITAAFLLGWPVPIPDLVHIVQLSSAPAGRSRDVVRHRVASLPDEDIVMINGLPVLAPRRTAVDCALGCTPDVGLAAVDGALRKLAAVDRRKRQESIARQDVVRSELAELLQQRGRVRHARRAREVIHYADGLSESARESWLRWLALSRGMPVPELQVPIRTSQGLRYPDALWWFEGIAGARPLLAEYDGGLKYRTNGGAVVEAEKDREELLREATGGTVLRFTRTARKNPDAAFARLLRESPLTVRDLTPRRDLQLAPGLRGRS